MAEMWDTELEDVFVLFSSTLAVATGILCLHVQLHLLLLHREHQRREEGALLLQQLESRRISDSLLAEPLFYILCRPRSAAQQWCEFWGGRIQCERISN
jgi:hypothetical protein